MPHPAVRRCAVVAGAMTGALLLFAGSASAHVSVNPREEARGSYAKLTFRVPNESDSASTVKLTVSFPRETPLASVRVKPHPGWTASVQTAKLPAPVTAGDFTLEEAVASVTWTAQDGARIRPGEFDEFEVSVGPLPDTEALAFPAVQTYDDGEVVRWDQPTKEGAPEPDRPAPVLTLVDGQDEGHGHAAPTGDTGATPQPSAASAPAAPAAGVDQTARVLAGAGLAVAALCLVAVVLSLLGVRRRDAA